MSDRSITRRTILGSAAAGAAAWAMGTVSARAAETGKALRIGVIGIGKRCRAHLGIMKGLRDRCRIVATCDIVPERAAEGARIVGGEVKAFATHRELLAAKMCDAVVITTPNYTHKEIACDALGGSAGEGTGGTGYHVLCEKPMATTLADADAMVAAVKASGRTFGVGLQFRYAPVYVKARELLASGAIGELKYVSATEFRGDWVRLFKDDAENKAKNWRYYQRLSGGTLVEKNCHDFDILGSLIGRPPLRVTATGGNAVYKDRETLDHAAVTVEFDGGIKLLFGMNLYSPVHQSDTVFVGTKGLLQFPRGGTWIDLKRPGRADERIDVTTESSSRMDDRGVTGFYRDWLDAIDAGRQPKNDVNVGRGALIIALAAQQAIKENRVINIADLRA